MGRTIALFTLLWVASASGLAAQAIWPMTPVQRGYLRPEIEAELLAPISFHVPLLGVGFDPHVTAVFVPSPRAPARWMSVPATIAVQSLASLYPERLLLAFARLAAIAIAEAGPLYLVVLVTVRYIARRARVGSAVPVAPAAPSARGGWGP